jgi:hypothetical protein
MNSDNGFKRLLRAILMYDAGESGISVKEIAPLLGVSEAMIYRYCRGTDMAQMPFDKARALSRYLIAEYGDRRIADYFDGDMYITTNGRIDDEIVDLDLVEGKIIEAYRAGDADGARRLVLQGEAVFQRLKAELEVNDAQ